jgi:hypothetical protein
MDVGAQYSLTKANEIACGEYDPSQWRRRDDGASRSLLHQRVPPRHGKLHRLEGPEMIRQLKSSQADSEEA